MKPSFRALERNENVRNCLISPCDGQMGGNFICARTANSDPNKIQIRLWCAWLHKNTGQYPVFPHIENALTEHTSVHYIPMAEILENVRWASTLLLEENPKMCGTQPPAESVQLPAIHWLLSNKTADKHSRASSGTEPCHWQEGEINEHPRGNQVWSCLFPKTCKNLGASWLWMLDKASTWSAHSGKLLSPADYIFMVIHHHIFHGSEDKISHLKMPESKRTVQENSYFPMEVNAT